MKLKEYRKKLEEAAPEELRVLERDAVQELFSLRLQLSAGGLEDKSKVRQLKQNLARIKTVLQEKKDGTFRKKRGLEKTRG